MIPAEDGRKAEAIRQKLPILELLLQPSPYKRYICKAFPHVPNGLSYRGLSLERIGVPRGQEEGIDGGELFDKDALSPF